MNKTISNVSEEQRADIKQRVRELETTQPVEITDPALPTADELHQRHQDAIRKLDRFLLRFGATDCPVCGRSDRYLHPALRFFDDTPVAPPLQPLPLLLPTSCRHCGSVRFFAAQTVLQTSLD